MIKQPPNESPACSWFMAGLWTLIIWLTVPFARRLERAVEDTLGSNAFTFTVLLLLALGSLYVLLAFIKDRQRFRWTHYAWLALVFSLLGWQTVELKQGSPIEALHFIEYGILALLFFRALVHHCCSPVVYWVVLCCCLSVGLLDEGVQWLTPNRYFDWRDIGLNAYASVLICLLLAKGLAPSYLNPITRAGYATALRFTLLPLTIAALALLNTPQAAQNLVARFPVLEAWSENWGVMTEYGYIYHDQDIGTFKSRLAPEQLMAEDRERGFEASQILSLRRYTDYGELLREFNEFSDPYIHEAAVHLHSRDQYLKRRIKYRGVDDEKYRSRTFVGYREEEILQKYFPVLMKDYWHQISPEWWADMTEELPDPLPHYTSRVSQGLMVDFTQKQVVMAYAFLLVFILSVSRWLNRAQ